MSHPTVRAEADRFSALRAAMVGAAALVLFALATWLTHRVEIGETKNAPAPVIRKDEVGLVNQTLFEMEKRAAQKRMEQERHLSTYGWVDRKQGLIWVPIEQAMREMASGSGEVDLKP